VDSSDPSDKAPLGLAPLTTSWGTGAVIPTGGRYRAAGVSPDGRFLYMFGGFDPSNSVLAESWKYDSQTDVWTALAPMPTALTAMEAAVIGGYVYLVGGYTGAAHTNDLQIYNILGNSWQATTWPNARTPMTAAWNGQLFAFGGNPGPSGETWKYTPGTGLWTGPLSPMPTPASYGAAVTVGDHIFVIGGGATDAIQRYNPASDTWDASGPALPAVRMSPGAIWYGDLLYVSMGGGSGGNIWTPFSDTLILNPALWPSGSWTPQGETVPTPLVGPACDCVKNSLYLMGGTPGGGASDANQNLNDGWFCHFPGDLPWLSLAPTSGTIPAGASQPITVHFDASAYANPTVLQGQLGISHNTPYPMNAVPVTMNVTYAPVEAVATASTTSGLVPLTVSFTGTASGGDGGPYTYEWDFDDGSPHLAEQNPIHTFSDEGTFTVRFRATDSSGHFDYDEHLAISVGSLPAVTLVTPSSGPSAGGTTVTIYGAKFTGVTGVLFGTTPPASFTLVNDGQITTTSPAHAAGVVDVRVITSSGTSPVVAADQFTYVDPPAVTALLPITGTTAGGTSVTVSGTGFSGATAVSFGGTPATFLVNSSTQITATSPAHAGGMVDVQVTGPYGTSGVVAADHFTYVAPPAVVSVTPAQGPAAGGTSVTISGSSFTGATAVSFGGIPAASFAVNASTQITATSPAHSAGVVDILVTTPYGTSPAVTGDHFTYTAGPAVTGITPIKGSSSGGTPVSISGTGFQAGAAVSFGGAAATGVTVSGGTLITATAPAHAAGAVSVTVTNPDGQSSTLAGAYTYMDPPVITFAKAGGSPFVLTLNGSNFHNPCTIFINGTAVPVTKWKSATLLKGKGSGLKTMLPKGTMVQITVTNDDGITSVPFPYTR
jgi:PKD repeat protein